MCSSIYLNSTDKLPLIEQSKKLPSFFLAEENDTEVIKALSTFFEVHNLYEAGSHMGCGCGFIFDQNYSNEDDFHDRIYSFKGLLQYLKRYSNSNIQLFYTSWDEDVFNTKIDTRDFKIPNGEQKEMIFPENVLLNIVADSTPN